jgi:nicotinate-nucleotide pyrophosphorylase (carboxylating)
MTLEPRRNDPETPYPRTFTPMNGVPAVRRDEGILFPLDQKGLTALVKHALEEDQAFDDVTTIACVVSTRRARGTIVARDSGVVCGTAIALEAFRQLDAKVSARIDAEDGTWVPEASPVIFLTGAARGLLSAERVAVNFMMHLSGIASKTRKFVDAVKGTGAKILDTRKTLPGLRMASKYAVRTGGGHNHRIGLFDGILIKENHIMAAGGVKRAVSRALHEVSDGTMLEVEVETLEQLGEALEAGARLVLLDNFSIQRMREAVELNADRAELEASGGVSLETVREIAETGVHRISIGSLTKDVQALDLSLRFMHH